MAADDRTDAGPTRLGVFGGTFDPIHVGHVVVAASVRHDLRLDRVLLVVAGMPWQKSGDVVASAEDRLAMAAASVAEVRGVEVCDLEVRRPGPTYTADTLAELAAPGRELFLILGADAAAGLATWERFEEVRTRATIVVVTRPGVDPGAPPGPGWRVQPVAVPMLDVSSTDLRARLADGRPVDGLVPPGAVRLIRERDLYTRR